MKVNVLKAEYYNVIIKDELSAAKKMLSVISKVGISLLAYKSVALGQKMTKFTLFAKKNVEMYTEIKNEGLEIDGPFPGLFIQGDDVPGALADIFDKIEKANIIINESSGIADINNGYGVVLYLSKTDVEKAYAMLKE
jgi:hypothetical protein